MIRSSTLSVNGCPVQAQCELKLGPLKHAAAITFRETRGYTANIIARETSILKVLSRALGLRCPACGESSIARGPFRVRHHCPNCRSLFKREEGFFVGAILANVMATEFVILLTCMIWLLLIGSDYEMVLAGAFVVALLFPVAFYHHSWSLWLGFDYLIEGLPKYDESTS